MQTAGIPKPNAPSASAAYVTSGSLSAYHRIPDQSPFVQELDTWSELFNACVSQGQAASTFSPQNTSLDVNVFLDPVLLNISQFAIHTVDTALHSWKQVTHHFFHKYGSVSKFREILEVKFNK